MKSVNASFTITREGIVKSFPMPNTAYARYVTLQIALAGALVQLIGLGTRRSAQLIEDVPPANRLPMRGTQDLSFSLVADHGAGASQFGASWVGVSKAAANRVEAIMMMAYKAATAGDADES